jgi:hypothetical protein
MQNTMTQALAGAAPNGSFMMSQFYALAWPNFTQAAGLDAEVTSIRATLGEGPATLVFKAILRHSFLIELVVLPGATTTRMTTRWTTELTGDPRRCPANECAEIAADLVRTLPAWLKVQENCDALSAMLRFSVLPYEVPLDYLVRPVINSGARIHTLGNIAWTSDPATRTTVELRRLLMNPANPDSALFKAIIDSKVKVKTYLTDRALTGSYKTNREKRWETHPDSVQFARRTTCLEIERLLLTQLARFSLFPAALKARMEAEGIVTPGAPVSVCPVTLEPMEFARFAGEILNPTHGKSLFQVGHLNPLKLDQSAVGAAGHTADNISWISADGNRIQGSGSLDTTRALLARISLNYKSAGLA